MKAKKTCVICGREYEARVNNQKCCSPECSDIHKANMAEKYKSEQLETIGDRKLKKKESVFAGRLKLALQERGITQKELAVKLGTSPTTINDYVVGRREPNARTKLAIAQALGVGIGYLLGKDSVDVDELLLMIDDKENSSSTPIEGRIIYHTAKVVLQELILSYKEAQ